MIFICFKKLTFRQRISRGGPPNGGGVASGTLEAIDPGCGDSLQCFS